MNPVNKVLVNSALVALCLSALPATDVAAQTAAPPPGTFLCDVAYTDCREKVLSLIRKETVGIDLSFWFMTDARFSTEIIRRWNVGVPVRVIMDSRSITSKPTGAPQIQALKDAGIPLLEKPFGDIAHWKGMIFAGQKVTQFSGANYSPFEYVYWIPYEEYQDETIYFSTEDDVVQSLMRRFDDVWVNSQYTFYANPIARVRKYPTSYTIAPEFNLPPDDSYTNRLLPHLDAETQGIDVVMFRITDPRPADALIRAVARGVPVRLYGEPDEYRNAARREDAHHVDRLYMGGVHIRMRAHRGLNHQKSIQLVGQHMTIFGTSNWSAASDDNQLEVNYFTTKDWFYQFFAHQFTWKWNNQPLDGSAIAQTTEFVPLEPATPSYRGPANGATGVGPSSVTLSWHAGDWARKYDVYVGPGSNPTLYRADVNLGPSVNAGDNKSITVTGLQPGTTYSWRVVSKTMANVAMAGPLWRFTTSGTPPGPQPTPPDTTAPVPWLYSPQPRAILSGAREIIASVTDNVGIAAVQFLIDGVTVGSEDRSAPFKMLFDTTLVSNGEHTLAVRARDTAGNITISNTITVTVFNADPPPPDTTPPTVSVTTPADGSTVEGTTTVSATASDNVGVLGVQFKLNGVSLGAEDTSAPYSVAWDTTSAANSTHTLTAEARDAAGNVTISNPVTVTVFNPEPPPPDTTPPTVALTSPADGATVASTVTVSASAWDDRGIAGVQFMLDGAPLGAQDTSAPYSVAWNTASVANGTHTVAAVAKDAAGNTAGSSVVVTVSNTGPPPAPVTIVLRAASVPAGAISGNWFRLADSTAADGFALWNPDRRAAKVSPAPEPPQNYVDMTFDAQAGTAYHLWVRMRAENDESADDYLNDSIHVQFSDAVNAAGAPIYRIGATSGETSAQVSLQDSNGGPIAGWGWTDQAWGTLAPHIYFEQSGTHTLRIQQREDGAIFDQIVLSPDTFLTTPPGPQNGDNTIVQPSGPPPPPDTTAPTVSVSAPADGATVSGTTTIAADASDDVAVAGVQFKLDGANFGPEDTTAPYSISWDTWSVSNGSYLLTALARDAAGNTRESSQIVVTVVNTGTPPSPPVTIVLRAVDVPEANIGGNWVRSPDGTAADGIALLNLQTTGGKSAALEPPRDYVDITFDAQAGVAYHLWIRMSAQDNSYLNDSIHVQFSGAVDAAGAPLYRIGTGDEGSAKVSLQDSNGGPISGWGWTDQAWGALAPHIYFAESGTHTLRIQQREDGVMFDQIVLSPDTFLTTPPGPQNGDNTIVPR